MDTPPGYFYYSYQKRTAGNNSTRCYYQIQPEKYRFYSLFLELHKLNMIS
ncbi:Uncharacterized protein dnl_58840 [Desulfonema limicola]|uniref:Uncharacterized protein n=1 Tax=Desulfonema limicola TaxID=45656 RepID=A0A975GJG2_9BACT|nr:Uncharacterized protein dnl_58840 [Desulfonema limicola]